jgi:hypothetical protein
MNEALHDAGVEELGAQLAGLGVADAVDGDDQAIFTVAQIVENFGKGKSKSDLTRLYKKNGKFECMMCPKTCNTKGKLIWHLHNMRHFYSQKKLAKSKSKLAKEVSTRISKSSGTAKEYHFLDLFAMFVEVGELSSADTPKLSTSEKVQYAKIFKMRLQLIRCR